MKILITSDVHLNDFRSYNTEKDPRFRLHQFGKLAERIVEVVKKEKCEGIIIAGDLLHVATPPNYVINYAADHFLEVIAKEVPVYAISGQHEFSSRTLMSPENSLWKMYSRVNNVNYMDKKFLNLDGRKFYFQSWTPEQDLSHLRPNEASVFIGHVTISNSQNNFGSTIEGQQIESNKFDICFLGDIHKHQIVGNQIAIGTPIQNSFGDDPDTGLIILETTDLSWKRVKTETDKFKFLKFEVTDKTSNDPYTVTHISSSKVNSNKKLSTSLNVDEVVNEQVKAENLEEIHSKVLAITSKVEKDKIDLKFEVQKLVIHNFNSIDDFTFVPEKGITLIVGENGAGKTSLVEALSYALQGSNTPKEFLREEQQDMFVEIWLKYKNIDYHIKRGYDGKGYLKYWINDIPQEFENQANGNRTIKNDLSFLEMYDILYRDQSSPRFLSKYSYSERANLICKIINLDIVDRYRLSATSISEQLDKPITDLSNELTSLSSYTESMKELDLTVLEEDFTSTLTNSEKLLSELVSLSDLNRQVSEANQKIESLNLAISQYKDIDFDEAKSDTNTLEKMVKTLELSISELQTKIKEFDKTTQSNRDQLIIKQTAIASNRKTTVEIDNKLNTINNNTCYTCHQLLDKEITAKLITELNESRKISEDIIANTAKEIPVIMSTLKEISSEKDKFNQKIVNFTEQKSKILNKLSQIESSKASLSKYNSLLQTKIFASEKAKEIKDNLELANDKVYLDYSIKLISHEETLSLLNKTREDIATLNEKISNQKRLTRIKEDIIVKKDRHTEISNKIQELVKQKQSWVKYIQLMSPNGNITKSVLTQVSENLSTDKVKVVAQKTLAKGDTKPDFNFFLKVGKGWRKYDRLSGGQKGLVDVFVMSYLFDLAGGAGFLVLDETFGQLSLQNLEFAVDILKTINVNNIFIVSHVQSFPYYDSKIEAELVNDVTNYTII